MRRILHLIAGLAGLACAHLNAAPAPVEVTEWQPFAAQVRRVVEALEFAGAPLDDSGRKQLDAALAGFDAAAVQRALDSRILFHVEITPEMRVKGAGGDAPRILSEGGWRTFLVKVHNQAGTTARLRIQSPQAMPLHGSAAQDLPELWLGLQPLTAAPLKPELGGLPLEYRVLQLYARDAGPREAKFGFDVGQGTQDLGFRGEVDALFTCQPAHEVQLGIRDEAGLPITAALLIKDRHGHVVPAPAKRRAPDFFFHPQIYRADGETLRLPEGTYSLEASRGPESIAERSEVHVRPGTNRWEIRVRRWIDPAARGWISGDHHIHAAGCAHYEKPTEGVHAPDMMRHVLGEDLKVGANLTWGPCFDYQKQFFTGTDDAVSRWPHLLRYDIEVSGFGSHQSGHLCLLRLRDQMYPGGSSKHHWPTLGLNTLRWAKAQGALAGPAHSGWGLAVETTELPNEIIPPFDGIGANEYIVDVTHLVPGPGGQRVPAVDFMSLVDTPPVWELNIWYHTLNAGYRTRVSGETDFPCIYDERVGLGRSYVQLPARWTYEDWCEGIRAGRNYVGDGRSHLFDFRVTAGERTAAMGVGGSELKLAEAGRVRVSATVAARLPEQVNPALRGLGRGTPPYGSGNDRPFWSIERARIGDTRQVPVDLLVNGRPVAQTNVIADGRLTDLAFDVEVPRSAWIALRILPSSHTNPIFVEIGGRPIRERRSIQWCLDSVERCWSQKERTYRRDEHAQATAAYDHARSEYRRRLGEVE
jgi:hypothetical protein